MDSKTSLEIIKSIKQKSKNNDDLKIIIDLLDGNRSVYFPDKEIFCLEHLINKINAISNNNNDTSNNKSSIDFVNDKLLYKIIDIIYERNDNKKGFNQLLKNIKIGNVLFNIDYDNVELVGLVDSILLKIIIQTNVSLFDISSEKFIISFLNCFNKQRDFQNAESFIMNLSQIIPIKSHISNYEIFFKLIKSDLVKIKSMIEHEFFFNEKNFTFDLNTFIENMKPFDFIEDGLLVSAFELICNGYVQKSDKYTKEILDKAFKKFVEISSEKHKVLIDCLQCISNNIELKKLNDVPAFKTLESFITDEENMQNMNESQQGSVLYYAMDNNIEIGYKYHEKIFEFLKNQELIHYDVLKSLIQCFVDYKELEVLIKYFIKSDMTNIINDQQSADLLISQIHNLTGYQLHELLTSDDINEHFENIIIKGMLNVNTLTFIQNNKNLQDWLKDSIFQGKNFKNWEFMYHVLNLYSNSIIPNISAEEDAVESYVEELNSLIEFENKHKDLNNQYYYFALMKTYEISIEYEVEGFDKIESIVEKFVKKITDITVITKFFSDYISIINNFEKTNLFVNVFFKDDYNKQYFIKNFIDIAGNDIYEEEHFVRDLVKHVVDSVTLNTKEINTLHLTRVLPLDCFTKHDKQVVLNAFKNDLCDNTIVCKFLSVPTFKSSFEQPENFVNLFINGKEQIGELVWDNYINNINDKLCFEFVQKIFNIFDVEYLKSIKDQKIMNLVYYIIKTSNGIEKIETFMTELVSNIISLLSKKKGIDQEDYVLLFRLYQLNNNNASVNKIIVSIFETNQQQANLATGLEKTFNLYAAYCHITEKSYYHIVPVFFQVYNTEELKEVEYEGLNLFLKNQTTEQTISLIKDLIKDLSLCYGSAQVFIIKKIIKEFNKDENEQEYCKIFTSLLDKLMYHTSLVDGDLLDLISNIVITKSWMLKQYTLEMVIPFLIKTISESLNNDLKLQSNILLKSLKVISDFVNYQQFKLTRRTHLINGFIVFCMDFILQSQLSDSEDLYKNLNRLIMNFMDPININNNNSNQDTLKSNVLAYKQELRKYIYPIMLKYINTLCGNYTSSDISIKTVNEFRNGLKLSMYGIFDLLIKENINLLYNLLDYNGKLYFKKLYKDYENEGKWEED